MAPENPTFCARCTDIFTEKPALLSGSGENTPRHEQYDKLEEGVLWCGDHHESGNALIEAAEQGCALCRRILDLATDYYKKSEKPQDNDDLNGFRGHAITWEIRSDGTELVFLEKVIGAAEIGDTAECVVFNITPMSNLSNELTRPETLVNTSSETTLRLAKKWVEECLADHGEACMALQNPSLPARLIHVGTESNFSDVHLAPTESLPPSTHYTTLSHRWGTSNVLRLLDSNLDDLMRNIKWSEAPSLSTVFKDAIIITRFLGVQHIWIDSLCIVQNSPSDWINEAGNMCNVYKYAYCNIAAASTAEGDDSNESRCFWDRDLSSEYPFEVEFQWDISDDLPKGTYALRNSPDSLFGINVGNEPLYTRGWVLKERILARCVLHFTKSQVFFECSHHQCCELYPTGLPIKLSDEIVAKREIRSFTSGTSFEKRPRDSERFRLFNIWADLVRSYCFANLPMEDDKLVAISGLAREMKQLLDDNYYAGLWKSNLASHLLWISRPYNEDRDNRRPRPKSYLAPSWSWASTNSAYISPYRFDKCCIQGTEHIKVLKVKISGTDSFGKLTEGHIILQGCLTPISFIQDDWVTPTDPQYSLGASGERPPVLLVINDFQTYHFYLDDWDDTEIISGARHSFALPVFSHPKVALHHDCELQGLLIARTTTPAEVNSYDGYKRIGYFELRARDSTRTHNRREFSVDQLCTEELEKSMMLM